MPPLSWKNAFEDVGVYGYVLNPRFTDISQSSGLVETSRGPPLNWPAVHSGSVPSGGELIANFSMNAVRRLDLAEGGSIPVELPADRVLVFSREACNG